MADQPPAKEIEQGPAPNDLLSFYIRQNEWTPTTPRGPVAAMYASPGPAIVGLPATIGGEKHDFTRHRGPTYKIGIKTRIPGRDLGPGPGKYDIRGYTNQGKDKCKAPLIGIKIAPLKKARTPGPADYSPENCDSAVFQRPPAYTMRIKPRDMKKFTTPAANSYTLPSVLGLANTPYANRAPGYTMRIKPNDDWRGQKSPGPAAYPLPSSNVIKPQAPSYTIPKATKPVYTSKTPGPLDHMAERATYTRNSAPKSTFGIKHSPYKAFPGFAAES